MSSDGGALMSPGTLLAHLMTDDDDGAHSPNPTTYYLLKRKLRCAPCYTIFPFWIAYWLLSYLLGSESVEFILQNCCKFCKIKKKLLESKAIPHGVLVVY